MTIPPLATRRIAATLLAACAMLACVPTASAGALTRLRCEYRDNPLGIDAQKPRLSWVIGDPESQISNLKSQIPRGQRQTAYQVLVASTPELLANDQGDLWDSQKVVSDQSIQVEYAGKPLESRQVCHWKVRVWLGQGLCYTRSGQDYTPIARVQLDLTVSGQRVVGGTDPSWTWQNSSHTEFGWGWCGNGREHIDARRFIDGWSEVGCTTGDWKPVEEFAEPSGVATAQSCPPNRITKRFPVVKSTALKQGPSGHRHARHPFSAPIAAGNGPQ